MRPLTLCLVGAAFGSGCGGLGNAQLDPAYTGTWKGPATILSTDRPPFIYDETVTFDTTGSYVKMMGGLCYGEPSAPNLKPADGRRLVYEEKVKGYICTGAEVRCHLNVFTFREAQFKLTDDTHFTVEASGDSDECSFAAQGVTSRLDFTYTWTATKQ